MSIEIPDGNLDHLYPPFRQKVEATIAQANRECTGKYEGFMEWKVFEGFRSAARQSWLYAQGRTRPGKIVTKSRTTPFHGKGLAADIVWYDAAGHPHWDGNEIWDVLAHCAAVQGLDPGRRWKSFPDSPHVQPKKLQFLGWLPGAILWLRKMGLK